MKSGCPGSPHIVSQISIEKIERLRSIFENSFYICMQEGEGDPEGADQKPAVKEKNR